MKFIATDGKEHEVFLCDDGTLDTVISVDGKEFRFDSEYVADSGYRHESGEMKEAGLMCLAQEALDSTEECEEHVWVQTESSAFIKCAVCGETAQVTDEDN